MIKTLPGLVFDFISGLLAQLVFDIFSNEKKRIEIEVSDPEIFGVPL
jgi:hypothetical protein